MNAFHFSFFFFLMRQFIIQHVLRQFIRQLEPETFMANEMQNEKKNKFNR